jgi:hypothetical protein
VAVAAGAVVEDELDGPLGSVEVEPAAGELVRPPEFVSVSSSLLLALTNVVTVVGVAVGGRGVVVVAGGAVEATGDVTGAGGVDEERSGDEETAYPS